MAVRRIVFWLNAKRFGLFRDLVPQAAVIGVLTDSTNPRREYQLQDVQAAARSLAVPIRVMSAGGEGEIEAAFGGLAREGVTTLFVLTKIRARINRPQADGG